MLFEYSDTLHLRAAFKSRLVFSSVATHRRACFALLSAFCKKIRGNLGSPPRKEARFRMH